MTDEWDKRLIQESRDFGISDKRIIRKGRNFRKAEDRRSRRTNKEIRIRIKLRKIWIVDDVTELIFDDQIKKKGMEKE